MRPPREQVVRIGSCLPRCRRSARAWQSHARHPGDFPVAGKVTKGAPRAAPFGIPRCEIFALFALAYASRRAGFCHRKRPICHFEMVGKPVFVVSFGFDQEKYSAVNPWRGRRLVARLGATFGAIRGIGEGGVVQSTGVLCSLCRFCAASVQPTNRMITPFVDLSAQSTHYLL